MYLSLPARKRLRIFTYIKNRPVTGVIFWMFVFSRAVFPFQRYTNFSSPITVNDIEIQGRFVWAATTGGLLKIEQGSATPELMYDAANIPDLKMSAVCSDDDGNIWIGTKRGVLIRRTPEGLYQTFGMYEAAEPEGWDIRDILWHKDYVIVASSKGCSFYNTKTQKVKNVTKFGDFGGYAVHALDIHGDTLYLGCEEGYAFMDIEGDRIVAFNELDEREWKTVGTEGPVAAFFFETGAVSAFSCPAVTFKGKICRADSSRLSVDTTTVLEFDSDIMSLAADSYGNCWIGTEEDYIYRWDGTNLSQYTVNHLMFWAVNRVYTSGEGVTWCLPSLVTVEKDGILGYPWWQGIAAYDGEEWRLFEPNSDINLGVFGDNDDFRGICEDWYGNMWFGTPGGNVKRFDRNYRSFEQYVIGINDVEAFEKADWGEVISYWGKCDAIAQDSSKYLWFSNFQNNTGCLICYNPEFLVPKPSNYRRYFPLNSLYHIQAINSINVDVYGRIFVGGYDGKLFAFSHNGNPVADTTLEILLFPQNLLKVWDMASTPNGVTWMATSRGLYKYQNRDTLITGGLKSIMDFPTNIKCIEAENDTILWIGTDGNGLMRYNPKNDTFYTFNVTKIEMSDGLISNDINDLNIDRNAGVLWIATPDGLTRYELGHTFERLKDNSRIMACPNPYSKTRHADVTFYKIAPNSHVSIYDIRGNLVNRVSEVKKNINTSEYEWVVTWKPPSNIVPGTYFYVATPWKDDEAKMPKGYVGKLLIIP